MKKIWEEIERAKDKNGSISTRELDEILAANLDSVEVPEDFNLAEELAKDLKFLHPKQR